MGSCVSSLHNRSSDSAMKLRLSFGSKNDKLGIPPSPVKEKPAGRIKDVALSSWSPSPSSKTFRDYGMKLLRTPFMILILQDRKEKEKEKVSFLYYVS